MSNVLRIGHSDAPLRRRLAAIAFLDVIGYSRLMGADKEAAVRDWLSLRRKIIEPRVQARGGRVVDWAGDGSFSLPNRRRHCRCTPTGRSVAPESSHRAAFGAAARQR